GMKRISTKRKATAKLLHNSTFSVPKKMTAEAFKRSGLVSRVQPKGETRLEVKGSGKKKPKGLKYWKGKADQWFSEFIRLRDAGPDGWVKCCTCTHANHWRYLQNGHFVTRG